MTDRAARAVTRVLLAFVTWAGAGLGTAAAQSTEPPPSPGERIRIEVGAQAAGALGLSSPWEGTFIMVRQDQLVASNPRNGGVALPLTAVQHLRVQRSRYPSYALVRGAIVGGAFGVGMWRFLRTLCRRGCDNGLGSAWLPAVGSGLLVGLLVSGQGPGNHWVEAAVPPAEPASAPGAVPFSLSVPLPAAGRGR